MPMHPSFNNIIKFVTLLSPFMLTSYLVLESFFRQDLKGLILLRDKHAKFTDQWNRLNQEVERFKKNTNISN